MRLVSAILAVLLLAATAVTAFAADLTLQLGPGRDATQPGSVMIQDMGSQVKVTITMTAAGPGGASASQPAHIHLGTCPGVGAVKYPLTNVVDMKSETTVNATVADLMATQYAINVHESTTAGGKYTACVNLPMSAAAGSTATQLPRTGGFPIGMLGLLGTAFLGIGVAVRRR